MIVTEVIDINGTSFTRTYSDSGYLIHGGFPEGDYEEATDPTSLGRTYTETATPIDGGSDAEEIVNILTGGAE